MTMIELARLEDLVGTPFPGGTYTIEVGMIDSSTADFSLSLQDVSP